MAFIPRWLTHPSEDCPNYRPSHEKGIGTVALQTVWQEKPDGSVLVATLRNDGSGRITQFDELTGFADIPMQPAGEYDAD